MKLHLMKMQKKNFKGAKIAYETIVTNFSKGKLKSKRNKIFARYKSIPAVQR